MNSSKKRAFMSQKKNLFYSPLDQLNSLSVNHGTRLWRENLLKRRLFKHRELFFP